MSDTMKGVLFILLSAFGFALMSVFVKLSGELPATQKVLFRNGVSMMVSAGMIMKYKESFFFQAKEHKVLLFRSAFGTIGMVLFFYSIDRINIADANMINKLSSFFLIGFSAIFLKEQIKKFQVVSLLIAFVGTLFIIKPVFDIEMIPYLAALTASMFAGAAYTILRFLGGKVVYYKIVFYFSTFSIIVLSPYVALHYVSMTVNQVILLVLAGVFATVGQFGVTLAYRYAPASRISIFNYSNVLFATVFSYLIFNDEVDIWSYVGYAVVFVASYYMFYQNKRDV